MRLQDIKTADLSLSGSINNEDQWRGVIGRSVHVGRPGQGLADKTSGKNMAIILNKFREYQVNAQTEILILGTFSPDIPGAPDFFFGRSRIFLWHLLPQCWGVEPLQEAPLSRKKEFMSAYHIDFADIIASVDMPEEGEGSFDDLFIDSHVQQWRDIIALIDTLPALKAVYFTKKTFSGIPLMRARIKLAADYCDQKGIRFCKLETPSKFYSPEKLQQWKDTIVLQSTCLRV